MLSTVLSCARIVAHTFDLRISFEGAVARPGQFLHIKCGHSRLLRRPISLCGVEDRVARLVFAVKGDGTRWLAGRKPGDSLDVMGPLGNGFEPIDDAPVLLVGGGIGVPPLLFAAKAAKAETHALLGFRSSEHVCLASEFPSMTLFTDDGSAGIHGYPHNELMKLLDSGKWGSVFACGPHPLLRSAAKICAEAGVACFVSMEERMGCGTGACLVCACAVGGTYRRVCRDGPVFNAAEVNWNG